MIPTQAAERHSSWLRVIRVAAEALANNQNILALTWAQRCGRRMPATSYDGGRVPVVAKWSPPLAVLHDPPLPTSGNVLEFQRVRVQTLQPATNLALSLSTSLRRLSTPRLAIVHLGSPRMRLIAPDNGLGRRATSTLQRVGLLDILSSRLQDVQGSLSSCAAQALSSCPYGLNHR